MIYYFVKGLVRLGLFFYFRKITFSDPAVLSKKGPLLLACNHPNSFLDALILGAYFKHPVHFLARGDAFKKPLAKKLLTALKAIPIYRLSEGKENLALNDTTFQKCSEILLNGGIVLIFSEGLCLNQWKLRPMKKGTARIALGTWKNETGRNMRVLPAGLNYNTYSDFNKSVSIHFETPLVYSDINTSKTEGEQVSDFNRQLYKGLQSSVVVDRENEGVAQYLLSNAIGNSIPTLISHDTTISLIEIAEDVSLLNGTKRITTSLSYLLVDALLSLLLFIPAMAAYVIHAPLYLPLKKAIKTKTKGTVFYHSALFGALIITYPIYLILLTTILVIVFKEAFLLLTVIVVPILVLLYMYWKDSTEKLMNFFRLNKEQRKGLAKAI